MTIKVNPMTNELDLNDEATLDALKAASIEQQQTQEDLLAEKKVQSFEKGGQITLKVTVEQIEKLQRMNVGQDWKQTLRDQISKHIFSDVVGAPVISSPSFAKGKLVTGPSKHTARTDRHF